MPEDPPRAPSTAPLSVDFGSWADAQGNGMFRGRGALTIDPENRTFTFTGRSRRFWGATSTEAALDAGRICNVVVGGKSICMDVDREGGKGRDRFPFTCDSIEEAAALAKRLPARTDGDFLAGRTFHEHMTLQAEGAPWFRLTNVLIALNLLSFVIMGLHGAGWIKPGSMLPYIQFAANNGAATTNGEWWRLLTSMFTHYGIVHLVLNMWALYRTGPLLERLLGRASFALVYLGSGLLGAVGSILFHGDKVWSAGASGAIFGVYGGLIGYMLREKHGLPKAVTHPLLKSTLGFAGYNLIYGATQQQIDNVCHAGGFAAGLVLGWLIAPPLDPRARLAAGPARFWTAAAAGCVLMAIGVAETPRYSYIPADRATLEDVVHQSGRDEAALLQKQSDLLTRADDGDPKAVLDLETFAQKVAVPFYDLWLAKLNALRLRRGYESEDRRVGLSGAIRRRLGCYHRLLRDLKAKDSRALENFERDFALANAAPGS